MKRIYIQVAILQVHIRENSNSNFPPPDQNRYFSPHKNHAHDFLFYPREK